MVFLPRVISTQLAEKGQCIPYTMLGEMNCIGSGRWKQGIGFLPTLWGTVFFVIALDRMSVRAHSGKAGGGLIDEMAWDSEENGCTFYSLSFLTTTMLRWVRRNRELSVIFKKWMWLTYAAGLKCKLAENRAYPVTHVFNAVQIGIGWLIWRRWS